MAYPNSHPLRTEGYCEICKRNYRDVGHHMLDLHDGRGIHAWRCLSYRTGNGERCTFVDCNFTEMRMHYLKHHADELDAVKWKKGYYTAEDGHIVPGTPFYPSEHLFSAIDDPAFPPRRFELEEDRHPRAEAAATCSPMVRMNSAGGIYRQEARRWASEAPPRNRSRPP